MRDHGLMVELGHASAEPSNCGDLHYLIALVKLTRASSAEASLTLFAAWLARIARHVM